MKVLWITNLPFAYHNNLLGKDYNAVISGSWLYAAYNSSKMDDNVELHIATVANIQNTQTGVQDRTTFYVLPGGNMSNYDINSEKNIRSWQTLKDKVQPDLVFFWGTESKFSYVASNVFKNFPIIVYIQGVLHSIVNHFFDAVPSKYRLYTIKDAIDIIGGREAFSLYNKMVPLEDTILKNAYGVVVENDWCEDQCKMANPKLHVYRNYLPIRQEFYNVKWSKDEMVQHSIFTNAGSSTIKGHHILFHALSIVKQSFPDVKVYIPGINYLRDMVGLKRCTGYIKYLQQLYTKYHLEENVIFTGSLTAEDMAICIKKCNVYVMPSLVENHSSSLIEAMIVGAPCVSSLVGGTASLIMPGINGYLYNSLEPVTLAGCITRLFSNLELSQSFSNEALIIRTSRMQDFGRAISEIYNDVLKSV